MTSAAESYGTYALRIELGSDFGIGGTYAVLVSDKSTTFKK